MPNTELPAIQINEQYVWWLSILATAGLFLMWTIFWFVVWRRNESVTEIITKPEFFKVITVMGVIAATVVLSLANRIQGSLTAAILSGIAGYVLGSVTHKPKENRETKPPDEPRR